MDRINKTKGKKSNVAKFVIEQRDGESDMKEFTMQLQFSKFLDKTFNGQEQQAPVEEVENGEEPTPDDVPF